MASRPMEILEDLAVKCRFV